MTTDSGSFSLHRTLGADPAGVFRACTDAAIMAEWMWGPLGRNTSAVSNARVGGRWSVETDAAAPDETWGARFSMGGVYIDLVPDRRIVYTLHWGAPVGYNDRPVPDEVIIIELVPDGSRTSLTYTHLGIPDDPDAVEEHRTGTEHVLNALARVVEG